MQGVDYEFEIRKHYRKTEQVYRIEKEFPTKKISTLFKFIFKDLDPLT